MKGLIEGKSDPYAIVRVGTQTFCSRVIDEELNPQWGETYEVGELGNRAVRNGEASEDCGRCWGLTLAAAARETLVALCSSGDST